jgi:hypothetical protein
MFITHEESADLKKNSELVYSELFKSCPIESDHDSDELRANLRNFEPLILRPLISCWKV